MMILSIVFAVTIALGFLHQCDADLPGVGNCSFMEYYCTLREYESHFFKKIHKDPGVDCGLQFWILYYRSLNKAGSCNSKRLEVADIKEMQRLYCGGLDLEIPLLFTLSPCSDAHKNKIAQCVHEFKTTFSLKNHTVSDSTLCRKRGEAKMCTILAWQSTCNQSDTADGIFDKVVGVFNPFCNNDKDPWAVEADSCANYNIPYRNPECDSCSTERQENSCPMDNEDSSRKNGSAIAHNLFSIFLVTAIISYLNNVQ